MRRTYLFLILVMATSPLIAQKEKDLNVPPVVADALQNAYPGVKKIKWEKEEDNYEANFDLNQVDTSVLLDATGNILEKEQEIENSQLPSGVVGYVKSHYNQKIKEAAIIKNANGNVSYEAEIKGKDLLFDSNGKFIKESKD